MRISYLRTSTTKQSIEAQRSALGGGFAKEFSDEGISGAVPAAQRPGFAALLAYAREGDTVCVYAVDRLGRDAIDVQQTVRRFLEAGIAVEVHGLGSIVKGAGEVVVAALAHVADMERKRITERCEAGRVTDLQSLAATGKTHKGKTSLGRPAKADAEAVREWRKANSASIAQTAEHFALSISTVKRYSSNPPTRN